METHELAVRERARIAEASRAARTAEPFDRNRPGIHRQPPATMPSAEDVYLEHTPPVALPPLLDVLTKREAQVMVLRHGLTNGPEHTQAETALRLGISLRRVQELEAVARGKLKGAAITAVA